jgi:hypothetical protein
MLFVYPINLMVIYGFRDQRKPILPSLVAECGRSTEAVRAWEAVWNEAAGTPARAEPWAEIGFGAAAAFP